MFQIATTRVLRDWSTPLRKLSLRIKTHLNIVCKYARLYTLYYIKSKSQSSTNGRIKEPMILIVSTYVPVWTENLFSIYLYIVINNELRSSIRRGKGRQCQTEKVGSATS